MWHMGGRRFALASIQPKISAVSAMVVLLLQIIKTLRKKLE